MDAFATVLLWCAGIFAVLLTATLALARFVGSNEDGNDDHELQEPPDG